MKCAICDSIIKNVNGLGKHIYKSHKEISKKEYYDTYLKEKSSVCICGKEKKFRNLGEGYREYCSVKCRSDNVFNPKFWLGKKQPKEMIDKRISSTNQNSKDTTRKKTMIERYGVDNPSLVPEFSKKRSKINKKTKRTPEHQQNIINSKRKNLSLNHKPTTKIKISNALMSYYQTGDSQCVTVVKNPTNGRGHLVGKYNGILYRSSYELLFIKFAEKYNISIENCENIKRRVRYTYNNKKHWYYPDFYLPDIDVCIEIKPKSMMNEIFYTKKSFAEKIYKNFVVLTETELLDEKKLYEYFCSFL